MSDKHLLNRLINRRRLLLSGLALCAPALAREEFASLHFHPIRQGRQPAQMGATHISAAHDQAQNRLIRVMIDPGHGGKDPGAIGENGSEEKHVVLEIANNIKLLLEQNKRMNVRLTREEDHFIPLYERVNIAHRHDADIFLSIHADGFTRPEAHGASVFALSTSGASSAMARYLSQRENAADDFADIDVKTKDAELQRVLFDLVQQKTIDNSLTLGHHLISHIREVHHLHSQHTEQAAFVVLKSPSIPSVLIETSFITNPAEEKLLGTKAFRMKIARAIAGGVSSFFDVQRV
ncbi:N-acetylmuramoyl-L-alanine amidase AmiA [Martelella alba]|uniref:N-acetylmuramoyl-L-alanine amidase n=1 Tax=Martelella alba TaxID=2590451 RepID=A0ABY2SLX1_9HYPH|nr:N-acetylmuramoyl-L-alanine amidase AmiA [Martelella alba]TKI06065.1 N-acetylmuramoyl-L-alanine amidase AmiA [Martelella alba]